MADVEEKVIQYLLRSPDFTNKTLNIAKGVGFKRKNQINPFLHKMKDKGIVTDSQSSGSRVHWKIVCPKLLQTVTSNTMQQSCSANGEPAASSIKPDEPRPTSLSSDSLPPTTSTLNDSLQSISLTSDDSLTNSNRNSLEINVHVNLNCTLSIKNLDTRRANFRESDVSSYEVLLSPQSNPEVAKPDNCFSPKFDETNVKAVTTSQETGSLVAQASDDVEG